MRLDAGKKRDCNAEVNRIKIGYCWKIRVGGRICTLLKILRTCTVSLEKAL